MLRLKNSKAVAIVMAFVFCMSFVVPAFVTPDVASAAATYTSTSLQKVSTGNGNLGQVRISVPVVELQPAASGDFFVVRLPNDFNFNTPAGTHALVQVGATDTFNVQDTDLQIRIPNVSNAFASAGAYASANITVDVISDNEIKVNVANDLAALTAGESTAYFYILLNNIYVDSSAPATINASIEGRSGSAFGSGDVPVATFGSGLSTLSIDSVKTITASTAGVDKVRIKEDRPGSFATGQTIKVKLPNGYKWNTTTAPAAVAGIFDSQAGATVPGLSLADDSRTLVITSTHTSTTRASYFTIDNLKVVVNDETIAKLGDVSATLSGTATAAPSDIVVAKYGDYSLTVGAFGDPKNVTAGRTGEEIGKFFIEEGIAGSLSANKTITATLVGGAKWDVSSLPRQDVSNSKNWGAPMNAVWTQIGSNGDAIRLTLGAGASASAIKAVFEKAQIHVAPQAANEIKVVFSGSAGVTGEVVVAKVDRAVTAAIDGTPAKIVIGAQAAELPAILVKESKKEAISATGTGLNPGFGYNPVTGQYFRDLNNNGTFEGAAGDFVVDYATALSAQNELRLEFPVDVLPTLPTKVEVVEGDIVLEQSSVMRNVTADGRWYIAVTVKATSSKPSVIKFEGIKITPSRTVPEGQMLVAVKGSSVLQTMQYWPGQSAVAAAAVGNVVTPAPGETAGNGEFRIGSNIYYVGGVAKVMDAAPYIKADRTYVPVRYMAYVLGLTDADVLWDEATQKVTLTKGDKKVELTIGSTTYTVNGEAKTMDVAPEINNGRTMLPARYVAEGFGATVGWDASSRTVLIQQ